MLADATQGGINYDQAMAMTIQERRAAVELLKEVRDKQAEDAKRR